MLTHQDLFPTRIYHTQHPDAERINPLLLARAQTLREKQPATNKSMRGGWQSDRGFLQPGDKACDALLSLLDRAIHEVLQDYLKLKPGEAGLPYGLESWANMGFSNNLNLVHSHPRSSWSAVYYVSCPKSDPSNREEGAISFIDPRTNADIYNLPGQPDDVTIAPREGLFVLFPSWLKHMVLPHQADQPRLSIAMNVVIQR